MEAHLMQYEDNQASVFSSMDGGRQLHYKYDNLFKEIFASGWTNDSSGNTEAPCQAYAKFSFTEAERDGILDMLSHHDYGSMIVAQFRHEIETGHYLIVTDDNGLVWVFYGQQEAIDKAFELRQELYLAWADDEPGMEGDPI
jgi:hypothetical protein